MYWAARYELAALGRDVPLLLLALALPVATMALGGMVFSQGLESIPLCLASEDAGRYGPRLAGQFAGTARFLLVRGRDRAECAALLRNGTVAATVAIEAGHSARLAAEGRANVTVVVDNSLPFLGWVTLLECRKVLYLHLLDALANDPSPALRQMREQDPFLGWVYGQVSAVANPDSLHFMIGVLLGAREELLHIDNAFLDFYLPGLLTMAVVFTATTLSSLMVVRAREDGLLPRLLATPLSPAEYLASKLAVAFLLSLGQAAALLAVLSWYVGSPLPLLPLLGALAALALASCSLGLLLSCLASNSLHALEFAVLLSVVQLLLGSLVFPNIIMPDAVRVFEPLLPATHGVHALREVVLWKEPAAALGDALSLAALSAACCAAAWALLAWRERGG